MSPKLQIILSYLVVVIIWSTTPLAIKWSSEGVDYLFGVAGRMMIGFVILLLFSLLSGAKLSRDRRSLAAYGVAGLGIYATMVTVYWGSQFIPSGLTSVLFGLTPLVTGLMTSYALSDERLTAAKLFGSLLGALGLFVIFYKGQTFGVMGIYGAIAVFVSVVAQSLSAVWVKRMNVSMSAFNLTYGSMWVATILFTGTWLVAGGQWPTVFPARASMAIVYLGTIATVIGFVLYFYLISKIHVGKVGLLNLISPIFAIFIGNVFNQEVIDSSVWPGVVLIIVGLACYQWLGSRLNTKNA